VSRSAASRALPLFAAAAFIFFILASAPHSVHHVFKPHKTPENCLVFSLAHGCQVAAVTGIALPTPERSVAHVVPERDLPTVRAAGAPFSQRAPPAA